jgi:hypothetical protein
VCGSFLVCGVCGGFSIFALLNHLLFLIKGTEGFEPHSASRYDNAVPHNAGKLVEVQISGTCQTYPLAGAGVQKI